MDHRQLVTQRLLFQVPESVVRDVIQCAITENFQQWFVINCYDQVLASQDEIPCLVQGVGDG